MRNGLPTGAIIARAIIMATTAERRQIELVNLHLESCSLLVTGFGFCDFLAIFS